MSRYRPPRPPSSPLITPEGHARLAAELKHLWSEKRPEVTRLVAEAAAMGDRSENAAYIYGKKQLREIDARVRYLGKRLDSVKVIDERPADTSRVYFGAWLLLEDDAGARHRFRIVGADEIDPARGYISVDAPLARALLGRCVDDVVDIDTPDGPRSWTVLAIGYGDDVDTALGTGGDGFPGDPA